MPLRNPLRLNLNQKPAVPELVDEVLVMDNFMPRFKDMQSWCRKLEFGNHTNPTDGVVYPGINPNVPHQEWIDALAGESSFCFLRLSPSGVRAPHIVHNDAAMGRYTMILYINEFEGGTGLMQHKITGMNEQPIDEIEMDVWDQDHNNPDAWECYHLIEAKENRAVFFPSELMHAAYPFEGVGADAQDGRLVVVGFFE